MPREMVGRPKAVQPGEAAARSYPTGVARVFALISLGRFTRRVLLVRAEPGQGSGTCADPDGHFLFLLLLLGRQLLDRGKALG